MAEESSDEDIQDLATSKVLLGYASKEVTGDSVSRLGGRPSWLLEIKPPSPELLRCRHCKGLMAQLLQLDAELPDHFPGQERRLHIFACKKKACQRDNGSVRAVRASRIALNLPEKPADEPPALESLSLGTDIGSAIFGRSIELGNNGMNPFLSSERNASLGSQSAGQCNKSIQDTQRVQQGQASFRDRTSADELDQQLKGQASFKWPPQSDFPDPYPSYYLDAEYEGLQVPKLTEAHKGLPLYEEDDSRVDARSENTDADTFESSIDKTFQRFADRLGQNPEQVLRYEFKGIPLLYSKQDMVGQIFYSRPAPGCQSLPACRNCGKPRTFELQLTPHAIAQLEVDDTSFDGMDWGTIIIAVCSDSCQPAGFQRSVGYSEEWVGVQWEETKLKEQN